MTTHAHFAGQYGYKLKALRGKMDIAKTAHVARLAKIQSRQEGLRKRVEKLRNVHKKIESAHEKNNARFEKKSGLQQKKLDKFTKTGRADLAEKVKKRMQVTKMAHAGRKIALDKKRTKIESTIDKLKTKHSTLDFKKDALSAKHAAKQAKFQKKYDKISAKNDDQGSKPSPKSSGLVKHSDSFYKKHVELAKQEKAAKFGSESPKSAHPPLTKHEFSAAKQSFANQLEDHEKAAILKYSGESYTKINGKLRSAKGSGEHGEHEAVINSIDSGLAKSRAPKDMVVYRGAGSASRFKDLKPGDSFVDHGYTSTSTKTEVAHSFGGSTVFHITVKKGAPAAAIPSQHAHESEILLPRGTKFTVSHVETSADLHSHDPFHKSSMTIIHVTAEPPHRSVPKSAKKFSSSSSSSHDSYSKPGTFSP